MVEDDYATGRLDGEKDVEWQFRYVLLGMLLSVIGILIAIFYLPEPPQSSLQNKSASYILGFTEGYQKKKRSWNIICSITGLVIVFILIPVLIGFNNGFDFLK
jgi:hypothetical protein